jgi:hypothetical protein
MQNSWFSQIKSDIFISHSHRDLDTALVLIGWLWEGFDTVSSVTSLGTTHDISNNLAVIYQFNRSLGLVFNLSSDNSIKPFTENRMLNRYVEPST